MTRTELDTDRYLTGLTWLYHALCGKASLLRMLSQKQLPRQICYR